MLDLFLEFWETPILIFIVGKLDEVHPEVYKSSHLSTSLQTFVVIFLITAVLTEVTVIICISLMSTVVGFGGAFIGHLKVIG